MAVDYLKDLGYSILERNFRSGRAEIDVIAMKDNKLIFVEVKTRTGEGFGFPEEAVDDKKQEMLEQCAEDYMLEKDWKGNIRFDVIAVSLNRKEPILHIEDAF